MNSIMGNFHQFLVPQTKLILSPAQLLWQHTCMFLDQPALCQAKVDVMFLTKTVIDIVNHRYTAKELLNKFLPAYSLCSLTSINIAPLEKHKFDFVFILHLG